MNAFLKLSIFIVVDFLLFEFQGFWFGVVGLIIIIWRALNIFGILRSPSINRKAFFEGIAFLKDYQGPYSQNISGFEEAAKILKNFKLDQDQPGKEKFGLIGIYYDSPGEVQDSKLRCSIGIYQKSKGFPEKPSKELESYCLENNYYYTELPSAGSIYSEWEYPTFFTLGIGIKKFFSKIKKSLRDANFRRSYRLNDNMKCDVIIELYESDSKVSFYVPYLNSDKFKLYKRHNKYR